MLAETEVAPMNIALIGVFDPEDVVGDDGHSRHGAACVTYGPVGRGGARAYWYLGADITYGRQGTIDGPVSGQPATGRPAGYVTRRSAPSAAGG